MCLALGKSIRSSLRSPLKLTRGGRPIGHSPQGTRSHRVPSPASAPELALRRRFSLRVSVLPGVFDASLEHNVPSTLGRHDSVGQQIPKPRMSYKSCADMPRCFGHVWTVVSFHPRCWNRLLHERFRRESRENIRPTRLPRPTSDRTFGLDLSRRWQSP